jgi:low temperature requirement protein LtrA
MNEKENTSNNTNRHATWLELFYDLVFVVVIFQLAHNLEEDFSLNGFLVFLALFIPVWFPRHDFWTILSRFVNKDWKQSWEEGGYGFPIPNLVTI